MDSGIWTGKLAAPTNSNAKEPHGEGDVMAFMLYKIYYGNEVAYLGRTKQPLQDRLHGHFFFKKMYKGIDIFSVTKIEYAEFPTEADMFLYEIYYINLYKPLLNRDDKARDSLTVELPPADFAEYHCNLMDKWKVEAEKRNKINARREASAKAREIKLQEMRKAWHNGEITEDEYYNFKEAI